MSASALTRVLVVDDNEPTRILCRIDLEARGIEVLEAADGHTGAELARRELPDAILLDVMLPTHNGLQVAEDLAGDSATAAIPIIFLTALGEGARERGMALGARGYVTKPFDPAALGDLVERVVAAA